MEKIYKEQAEKYKSEFGENAYRVVELLMQEHDEEPTEKGKKRCLFLIEVLGYLH